MIKVFVTISDMPDGRTAVGAEIEAIEGTQNEQAVFHLLDAHLRAFNEELESSKWGTLSREEFEALVRTKQQ